MRSEAAWVCVGLGWLGGNGTSCGRAGGGASHSGKLRRDCGERRASSTRSCQPKAASRRVHAGDHDWRSPRRSARKFRDNWRVGSRCGQLVGCWAAHVHAEPRSRTEWRPQRVSSGGGRRTRLAPRSSAPAVSSVDTSGPPENRGAEARAAMVAAADLRLASPHLSE